MAYYGAILLRIAPFSLHSGMRYLLLFLLAPMLAKAQEVRIAPADINRAKSPVRIIIPRPGAGQYALLDPTNAKKYPLQWEDGSIAWFFLDGEIPAGHERIMQLTKIARPKNAVTFVQNKNGIAVKQNGHDVLFYQVAMAEPPADSPSYYRRNGFIHPVYSPSGKVLTDDFPSNHAHQHALFHAWTNTRFRNRHVDFWNQHHQEGTVRFKRLVSLSEGPVYSEMITEQEYVSLSDGVVLEEQWKIRFFAMPDQYLFDISVDQQNITNDTLFLDKYIYGGMAFRGSSQWDPHNKDKFRDRWSVITSEGLKDSAANHRQARWVNISGKIDGAPASLTIFDHTGNLRHPQKLRVHPDMPYLVYSPIIDEPLAIPAGGTYSARYRYLVKDGNPTPESLQRIYENWIGEQAN